MSRAARLNRRAALLALSAMAVRPATAADDPFDGDPYESGIWIDMRRQYLGGARVTYDRRVEVRGPAFAEDPMNVPISVRVDPALGPVDRIAVLVDRNPIRLVLDYEPLQAQPAIGFRFKLEQASPVRAAVLLKDGRWVVGGTLVDSSGGGCTVPGATRADGSWTQSLGQVSGRLFPGQGDAGARLRVRVMHPMDTGLANGIPAFYVNRLSVQDAAGHELARLKTYEPVSENPVLSFDFAHAPEGGVRLVGTDNNGNRIDGRVR